jgi:DNA-binding response OmpR family regulator
MPKLLVVDDDKEFVEELRELMRPHGWMVETALNGSDARQLLRSFQYDLVLLDWVLPDATGFDICQEYRRAGKDTPIIFLTAMTSIDHKESGLDAGGDDYLTKPFEGRELLARIRSLRRRSGRTLQDKLIINGVQLHTDSRTLSMGPQKITLSSIECDMLEYLFRHPDKIHSSSELFEAVWPADVESSDATVRVHITRIRKKLESIGAGGLIQTIPKAGYIISLG